MENDPTNVTIKVLCTELQVRFACTKETNKNSKKKDGHTLKAIMRYNDAALGTFLVKQFKGSYNKYDKYGHKSIDCQDKQVNDNIKGTDGKAASNGCQFNGK